MDWKKENIRTRYIDSITDEEALKIASLSKGCPEKFQLLKVEREVNGNNIPHVKIYYEFFSDVVFEIESDYMGIFRNLDIYTGSHFHSCYCQKEIFDLFKKWGFE